MLKEIISEIPKALRNTFPDTPMYLEEDFLKSPSLTFWITDNENDTDTYSIMYCNIVVREEKENIGNLANQVLKSIQEIEKIETIDFSIFGIEAEQGARKLRYTEDNQNIEHLIMLKIYYSLNN